MAGPPNVVGPKNRGKLSPLSKDLVLILVFKVSLFKNWYWNFTSQYIAKRFRCGGNVIFNRQSGCRKFGGFENVIETIYELSVCTAHWETGTRSRNWRVTSTRATCDLHYSQSQTLSATQWPTCKPVTAALVEYNKQNWNWDEQIMQFWLKRFIYVERLMQQS